MTFNDFIHKYKFKNKETSNLKTPELFSAWSLNEVGIQLRDGPFESDIRIVNLHLLKGTHWVACINEIFFDSFGCAPPQKLSKIITKQNWPCLYSDYKIQGMTSRRCFFCAAYCSFFR